MVVREVLFGPGVGQQMGHVGRFLRAGVVSFRFRSVEIITESEYLRNVLPGLFALGEKPQAEQVLDWLPGRWLLSRMRNTSIPAANAG